MKKYIIGFLIGIAIMAVISYDIINTMKIEHDLDVRYERCISWHEGFKLGIRYQKAVQRHEELMERK